MNRLFSRLRLHAGGSRTTLMHCLADLVENCLLAMQSSPNVLARAAVTMMVACSSIAGTSSISASGPDAKRVAHFENSVRPLLVARCINCHGPDTQEAGLRLDTPEGLHRGAESGPVIVAGSPETSRLIELVRGANDLRMPPDEELDPDEIAALERWVREGAFWPDYQKETIPDVAPLTAVLRRAVDDPILAPHLAAWYRADTLALDDGAAVSRWPDSSGHARDLLPTKGVSPAGTGEAPRFAAKSTVNDRPAVRFGELSGLASSVENAIGMVGDPEYTIIVVTHLRPTEQEFPYSMLVSLGDPSVGANPGRPSAAILQIDRTPLGDHQLDLAGGFGHDIDLGPGSFKPLYRRAAIISAVKRFGPMRDSGRLLICGLAPDQKTLGHRLNGTTAVPALRQRGDFDVMLGHSIAQTGAIVGDVAEVVIYNRALDEDQRQSVEAALIAKYQITVPGDWLPPVESETASKYSDEQRAFWAYQPVRRPEAPQVAGVSDPIDAFVVAKLQEKGLVPAPRADKRTLIRRATFDLTGLPPRPEEIDAFLADDAPDAFAKLVDRLLASPQYGERWGRHWLDVARYADTGGYETDIYYRNAWRYRDYVVKSFNDDKPYDRFVQEQIAGDELWPDNLDLYGSYTIADEKTEHLEARLGTGLYALGPQIHESNMDAPLREYERLSDWVDTTGAAFLGMTVGCARCHDHKFDPISQRDYFALQAVFAGSKEVDVPIVHALSVADFKQHYPAVVRVDEARKAFRLFESRTAGRPLTADEAAEAARLRDAIGQMVLSVPTGESFDGLLEIPTATVLGHEDSDLVRPVRLLQRGDVSRPLDDILPAFPAILADATDWEGPLPTFRGSRKQLALWLTRPNHPLTARVMVNRLWHWHFGRGIVATPNDFGKMGLPPSHPELLDWLASEFVEQGWSIKGMQRRIMLSETYQRACAFEHKQNRLVDSDNHYLWRMNRRRLESEVLWDSLHSVAGTLNLKMGGRPVMPPLAADELTSSASWFVTADPAEHTRRGLYILVRRNFKFPMFGLFDAPVNSVSCPTRDDSTVAPQALWFMNNTEAFEQSVHFADRLVREAGDDQRAWINRAWLLALGRPPSDAERAEAATLLEVLEADDAEAQPLANPPADLAKVSPARAAALAKFCLAILNLNEFTYID